MRDLEIFLLFIVVFLGFALAVTWTVALIGPTISVIALSILAGMVFVFSFKSIWGNKVAIIGGMFSILGICLGILAIKSITNTLPVTLLCASYAGMLLTRFTSGSKKFLVYTISVFFCMSLAGALWVREQNKIEAQAAKEAARAKVVAERCERPVLGRIIKFAGGCR